MSNLKGFQNLLEVKKFIVENFASEHFLEIGVLTGWDGYISNHPRLLRSLSWNDPDYPSCVMDLLAKMERNNDGSVDLLCEYIDTQFRSEKEAMINTASFASTQKHLGYKYEQPRNDVIAVMMPFSPAFEQVYSSIVRAGASTGLSVRRADQVWGHSTIIHDILELINHAAVVVCDLTGRNENVFYELGVAHAWGKPVVPITQSDTDVPADIRHHRYLPYLNNSEGRLDLETQLGKRLKTLLGTPMPF